MKICVCSDSHGNWHALQEMADLENPDMIIFLGDGERDWNQVELPRDMRFAAVCGNCDLMAMEPPFRRFELCGKKIFMTHGHLYGAKQDLFGLHLQATKSPTDLVLYGHTHRAKIEELEGCTYLCPGNMGFQEARYAVLTLRPGDSRMDIQLKTL